MARIVVAGGAGFIGSHLCDRLLARGDDVVAVDNLVTGRVENVKQLADRENFALVIHDVSGGPVPVDGHIDIVMNLASPASPIDFVTLNVEIMLTGSLGTRHLLDLAVLHGARYFQASTSEIYGDPLVHPQPESYLGNVDTMGPRGCYDEAKRFAEALTMAYHRRHGLDVRIARIFNTYGPRMRPTDGRVVTNFITAALTGEPLVLYGDGSQTRSFCYVSDEVAGLLALADAGPGTIDGPVNVGNDVELTIRQLAEMVVAVTGSRSPIVTAAFPDERVGDPALRRPDLTRARTLLGWEPTVDLRDGLTQMVEWMQSQR